MSTPTKEFYAKAKYFTSSILSSITMEGETNGMALYVCRDKIAHLFWNTRVVCAL